MKEMKKSAIAATSIAAVAVAAQQSSNTSTTRKEDYIQGIPGGELKKIERTVPDDEPPQLPPNSELKVIGKRIPRLDGHLKVSGRAKYASDMKLPGMLYGRT